MSQKWNKLFNTLITKVFLTGMLSCSLVSLLSAQITPQGFPYRGMAFDDNGRILPEKELFINVQLSKGPDVDSTVYSEIHQVTTDLNGTYELLIGQGYDQVNSLDDIPWEKKQIFIHLSWIDKKGNPFQWESSRQLYAVPYALYAERAASLADAFETSLRSTPGSSIYWLTSGNYLTRPPYHYIGTADERDLVFKTNNIIRAVLTVGGQWRITADVNGSQHSSGSYPLVVKGKDHGIWIQVKGSGTGANNFVTFADKSGQILGRIEGQTQSEWEDDWKTKLQKRQYSFKIASMVAQGVGLGLQLGVFATPAAGAGAGVIAGIVDLGLVVAGFIVDRDFFNSYASENMGINYDSGSADYGEWLPKADSFLARPGLIVGEHHGEVSLVTEGASSCRVLSRQSAVLGNKPEAGKEDQYVPVALLGQVPVRVVGPVRAGDYILPTGRNDGLGRAVAPADLNWDDFSQILGIAWETDDHELIHTVNVAVGLNANDVSAKMDSLNRRLDMVIDYLLRGDRSKPLDQQTYLATTGITNDPENEGAWYTGDRMSQTAFDRLIDQHATDLSLYVKSVQSLLEEQGIAPDESELLYEFMEDPVEIMKTMRRDPALKSIWPYIDARMQNQKTNR